MARITIEGLANYKGTGKPGKPLKERREAPGSRKTQPRYHRFIPCSCTCVRRDRL